MIPCADGTSIHSWLLYHPEHTNNNNNNNKLPTILFFHGNAGNIGMRLPNAIQMYHYLKANIWLIEYRGFGDSDDAVINEAGLKMDAEAVWNYAHDNRNNNVDPKRLFVFGRSLGGAVAFHFGQYAQSQSTTTPTTTTTATITSTNNNNYPYPPLAGIIVENTFLSISEMVNHIMPYVAPFKSLILRMNWNSGAIAPTLGIPTLFLAGAKDTLVPHSHMLELFDRMKNGNGKNNLVVRMHVVKNGTHNETWMQGGRGYWMAIRRFMGEAFEEVERRVTTTATTTTTDSGGGMTPGYAVSSSGNIAAAAVGTGGGNGGVFQRTRSSTLTSTTASASSTTLSSGENIVGASASSAAVGSVEVDMGCEGEDAADMISSVGNFMGMAREAVKGSGVVGGAVAGAYKKKD